MEHIVPIVSGANNIQYNVPTVSGVGGSTRIHILAAVSGRTRGKQRHADGSIYLGRCALSAQSGKDGVSALSRSEPPSVCALRTRLARPVPTPRRCVLGRPATHA